MTRATVSGARHPRVHAKAASRRLAAVRDERKSVSFLRRERRRRRGSAPRRSVGVVGDLRQRRGDAQLQGRRRAEGGVRVHGSQRRDQRFRADDPPHAPPAQAQQLRGAADDERPRAKVFFGFGFGFGFGFEIGDSRHRRLFVERAPLVNLVRHDDDVELSAESRDIPRLSLAEHHTRRVVRVAVDERLRSAGAGDKRRAQVVQVQPKSPVFSTRLLRVFSVAVRSQTHGPRRGAEDARVRDVPRKERLEENHLVPGVAQRLKRDVQRLRGGCGDQNVPLHRVDRERTGGAVVPVDGGDQLGRTERRGVLVRARVLIGKHRLDAAARATSLAPMSGQPCPRSKTPGSLANAVTSAHTCDAPWFSI
jgi:hypothetical protein